jgi:membrane protease YdiL (CAAX protease family)
MKKHVLLRVMVFYLLTVIIFVAANMLNTTAGRGTSGLFSMILAAAGTYVLSLFFLRKEGLPPAAVGLRFSRYSLARFFCGLLGGLVMAALQPLCLLAWGHFHMEPASPSIGWIVLQLAVYLAAACREELVFRGYSLRRLDRQFGPWIAQAVLFGLFVLEHRIGGMSWLASSLGAGTGALLFGLASLKSRGLALPLGLHVAWNAGQWLGGFKGTPGIWRAVVEPGFEAPAERLGFVAYLAAALFAALIIYFYYRHETS